MNSKDFSENRIRCLTHSFIIDVNDVDQLINLTNDMFSYEQNATILYAIVHKLFPSNFKTIGSISMIKSILVYSWKVEIFLSGIILQHWSEDDAT